MTRQYPTQPIVGVGGVVIDHDRVLLVKRAHPPLAGEWSLPGGGVEVGERLQAAVAREVREETGVDVLVGPVVGVLDRIHRGEDDRVEYHFVIIDYLCTSSGGSVTPRSDAADARWVSMTDLDAYRLTDTARRIIAEAFDLARRQG